MNYNKKIVLLFLYVSLSNSLHALPSDYAIDVNSLKDFAGQSFEGFRGWLIRNFGYGQDIITHAQSVEMLPYRYVFLTSFLGGLTGAFAIYCLYKVNNRTAGTEIEAFTDSMKEINDYPLTFRTPKE